MHVLYSQETFPDTITKSLFLAGPSPRDPDHPNWRIEALELLRELRYDGHVFIPLPRDGVFPKEYDDQVAWEQRAMDRSDIIVFWIPRDLEKLPGFTTNVEFGQRYRNRNVVLGYPPEAPKNRYLDFTARARQIAVAHTLSDTLVTAIDLIGDGGERHGGECQVPIALWNTPSFQRWLQTQKAVGNRLDGCQVEFLFRVGRMSKLFYYAIHVDVFVAREGRNKSNEIVIARPDVKHTFGFRRSQTGDLLDTQIVLVREFRSTAATPDGFVREIPGGSSWSPLSANAAAAEEFHEETGIEISVNRLRFVGSRQVAGTVSAHKADCFAVELTTEELAIAQRKQLQEVPHGVVDDTERTYVEVWTLRELVNQPVTDWSNLGMMLTAVHQT